MRFLSILGILFLFVSCNTSDNSLEKSTEKKEKFVPDMYVASEMTLLMRSMYTEHEKFKKAIIAGKSLEEFPEDFLNIYSAKMTKEKPYNETFKAFSEVYIANERAIFNETNEILLKTKYNNAINTCISCHTTECVGPIPRIKKLLIN